MRARHLDVAALDSVPVNDGALRWHPVRRTLGVTGFGTNAYSADAGQEVVETHTEDAGHQEMYVVLRGRARFRSDDEHFEAGAGELVFYREGDITRGAEAVEDGTLVLAIGGNTGEPDEPAAWEHWFLADHLITAGEYEKACAILAAGLTEHPDHPRILTYLAGAQAMAGREEDAIGSLRRAAEIDPDAARTSAGHIEEQLGALRSRPDWPL
jgi:quercetin dioxygenase-like cupin family protein